MSTGSSGPAGVEDIDGESGMGYPGLMHSDLS